MKRAIAMVLALAGGAAADETLPDDGAGLPPSTAVLAVWGATAFPVGCWDAARRKFTGGMDCVPLLKPGDEVALENGTIVHVAEITRLYAGREVDPVPAWRLDGGAPGVRYGMWPAAKMAGRARPGDEAARKEAVRMLKADGRRAKGVEVVEVELRGERHRLVMWKGKIGWNWRMVGRGGEYLGGYSRD
jgi:hypothetical protein